MAIVNHNHTYICTKDRELACWFHEAADSKNVTVQAVICNPLGTEYMSAYRSVRHLADALATVGVPTRRFDYRVAGDSNGGHFESAFVGDFVEDIRTVVHYATDTSKKNNVVLIGIGLGATFAALAAETLNICGLVLWNPTVNGRRFVREQKLLSELLNKEFGAAESHIDAAGVFLTDHLQADFRAINLLDQELTLWPPTLVLERESLRLEENFVDAVRSAIPESKIMSSSDYTDMMNSPTDTLVPEQSIAKISSWVSSRKPISTPIQQAIKVESRTICRQDAWQETPSSFGKDDALFGIYCTPTNVCDSSHQWLFLNCGSEHHAGPHRVYTRIARELAKHGIPSLRFDIEGIGDSWSQGANADNNSYSPVALRDIEAALEHLATTHGARTFTVTGICAGAYHSFQCLANIDRYDVRNAVIINPLVFEWDYDNPGSHFSYKMHNYGKSARDTSRWMRLIRGEVDINRLVKTVATTAKERAKRAIHSLATSVGVAQAQGAALGLQKIRAKDRSFTLVLAQNDPGLLLLKLQAPRETQEFLKSGRIQVHEIPYANHGFSKQSMQDKLVAFVSATISTTKDSA